MTLSNETLSIINTSSSLIEENSSEIAQTMYILLFDLFPDYKKFFKNAPSHQHQLLSDSIAAYAVNINNIHILMPALEKIAKTHVRVGVKPENYKVIKKMILLSFKVVLKEKANEGLIKAWNEAIKYVAVLLIELEKEFYIETK